MRRLVLFLLVTLLALSAVATTLEQLSLDQMLKQATLIARGKVLSATTARYGAMIYTEYRLQVTERLKGSSGDTVNVGVPGGRLGALRQTVPGAPVLAAGQEYLIFIWTGPSGRNHILGLTQGLFDLRLNAAGDLVAMRGASDVTMVDAQGNQVKDQRTELNFSDLRERLRKAPAGEDR